MKNQFMSNDEWARQVVAEHEAQRLEKQRERMECVQLTCFGICFLAAVIFAYAAGLTWQSFN